MALCDDCVCKNQCGNDYVTFCLSYVKNVPLKWETNAVMQKNDEDLQKKWKEHLKKQGVKKHEKHL